MQRIRFLAAVATITAAYAAPVRAVRAARPVVAVFGVDGARARLSGTLIEQLTTYLGTELAASGRYAVVPPDKMRRRLAALRKGSYKASFDSSRQIAIGKELAAEKSLATRVMKVGRRCVITATLWDIRTSASERAAVVKGRCTSGGLMDALSVAAAKLTMSMDHVIQDLDRRLVSGHVHRGQDWQQEVRPTAEKTAAPYFHLPSGNAGSLPLRSTSAAVNIVGVIAQVAVKQTYENTGKSPLEAVYVFPGSTRAAIHGMRMKIGERIVEAEIRTRRRARQVYDEARRGGRRAALLEQKKSSVFMMSVANIMPGEQIGIEMIYSELLVPKDGVYELVYPTAVGPRYGAGADNPHLAAGTTAPGRFSFEARVQSPIGIKRLTSPSHKIDVAYASRTRADVKLAKKGGGDRDVVLRYRLAGDRVESGVVLYEGKDENFFVAMLEPPKKVRSADVTPREYVFVVDVSGSMNGWPLRVSKALIAGLFKDLRPVDFFNVVLFASGSEVLSPGPLRATPANLKRAFAMIDDRRGGGGTELLSALRKAYGLAGTRRQGLSRTVVVISDGFIVMEAPAYRFVRRHLNQANLFAFGIGSSVNRGLIEMLADAGMGRPFVVLNQQEAPGVAAAFRQYVASPVLTDIKLKFSGIQAYDVIPRRVPDLMGERPLVVLGKYRRRGAAASPAKISIEGHGGSGRYRREVVLDPARRRASSWPLEVLWARRWADVLMRQQRMMPGDAALKRAVAQVGLSYNIVTPFTSFIAADTVRAAPGARPPGDPDRPARSVDEDGEREESLTFVDGRGEAAPRPVMGRAMPAVERRHHGCGCAAAGGADDLSLPLLFGVFLVLRRRRR